MTRAGAMRIGPPPAGQPPVPARQFGEAVLAERPEEQCRSLGVVARMPRCFMSTLAGKRCAWPARAGLGEMDQQVGAGLSGVRLLVSVPPVQPQVGMAVLAGEQADGSHLRREKVFGGQQQPGADSAPLPVRDPRRAHLGRGDGRIGGPTSLAVTRAPSFSRAPLRCSVMYRPVHHSHA